MDKKWPYSRACKFLSLSRANILCMFRHHRWDNKSLRRTLYSIRMYELRFMTTRQAQHRLQTYTIYGHPGIDEMSIRDLRKELYRHRMVYEHQGDRWPKGHWGDD